MRRLVLAAMLVLLTGCAAKPPAALPAIATPGPVQQTQIQGFFRSPEEPAEVVELDAEHGCWAYRTDTLGMMIEFREGEFDGATVPWCFAEIAWRDTDPLETPDTPAPGLPEELAHAAQSVLFVPETERMTLIGDGELPDGGERLQRAGYGLLPDGGYVAIAVSGRYRGKSVGLTAREFAGLFSDAGCDRAVQLAAGPAAVIVFMGTQLNDSFDGETPPTAGGVGWGRSSY